MMLRKISNTLTIPFGQLKFLTSKRMDLVLPISIDGVTQHIQGSNYVPFRH